VGVGVGSVGSAILVHGSGGRPEDWRWVQRPLTDTGVSVIALDLSIASVGERRLR
jgi:hypothetical protein